MRPLKLIMITMWALAIAAVTGFFVARYTNGGGDAHARAQEGDAPPIEVLVQTPDGRHVPLDQFQSAGGQGELPQLFEAATFDLVDQTGEPFASDQLEGKVWVGFIFLTQCPTGACPVMVNKMSSLQEALPEPDVHFVSFTIDPDNDTPEVLASYAAEMGTGQVSDRWHLLTGGTRQEMRRIAGDMRLAFDDTNQHSTWFLLVDRQGQVRGLYGNTDETAMARLAADARQLVAEDQP